MLLNYLNRTLGKFTDEDGGGGPMKFGGVEINTEGMTEDQIVNIKKAQEAYNSSSTAGIESAKNLKITAAELKALKEAKPAGGTGLTAEDVKKIMQSEMGTFKDIADRGKQFNMERDIEKTTSDLRKEFSYLNDDQFKEAMKTVDVTFKNQDASVRNGQMFQNIAKIALGDSLRKNIDSVNKDKAMELLANNPEAMKEFVETYSKKMGIDINMPDGGFTNQKDFETKITGLNEEFKKERNSDKRKVIVQKIADTRKNASLFGFNL